MQEIAFISGQSTHDSRVVQRYVKGEASSRHYGYSTANPLKDENRILKARVNNTETLLAEKAELVEDIEQSEAVSIPNVEQRQYSADWDPR